MRIGIAIVSSGKRLNIDADPNMLGEEVIEQLLDAQVIQPVTLPMRYLLSFKDKNSNAMLDLGKTLEANGVEENDVLALIINGEA